MTRRCSLCNHERHNSRACPIRGVKLSGVRLDGSVRKSASMGNLSLLSGCSGAASPTGGSAGDGYASEGFAKGSSSSCHCRKKICLGIIYRERAREKDSCLPGLHEMAFLNTLESADLVQMISFFGSLHKSHTNEGTPRTEEEHRMFLLGLQKLGKGDWHGISRNFAVSRTPTQVASHAQKYFISKSNMTRRKRRSSLFDIVPDESFEPQLYPMSLRERVRKQQATSNTSNSERGM